MASEQINGRQLVLDTLRGKRGPRTPWVPFTGVQVGQLVGADAEQFLHSADLIVQGNVEAAKRYRGDGQCVVFDLQIEAEALGCDLHWAKNTPPSVVGHKLADSLDGFESLPMLTPNDARLPIVLDAMRRVKAEIGDDVALYGLVTGPFTLASHLRGSELFMDMFDDPAKVTAFVNHCGKIAESVASMYLDAGMDVIAAVDPMISQISESHFNEMVAPSCTSFFEHVREGGGVGTFFVCGNATRVLGAMAACKPESMSVDENVDLAVAFEAAEPHGVSVGGNLPLATVMLNGRPEDNMAEALRLLDKFGDKAFILSPGCDMPFDAPPENVEACSVAVHEPKVAQDAVLAAPPAMSDVDVEMPDYASLEKPLVEVVTLDSRSCAACGYMVVAVKELHEQMADVFDWAERSILYPENVARVQKLGLAHLPSIVINGQLAYESIIPSREELKARIGEVAGSPA